MQVSPEMLEKTKPLAQLVNRDGGFGAELNQQLDW